MQHQVKGSISKDTQVNIVMQLWYIHRHCVGFNGRAFHWCISQRITPCQRNVTLFDLCQPEKSPGSTQHLGNDLDAQFADASRYGRILVLELTCGSVSGKSTGYSTVGVQPRSRSYVGGARRWSISSDLHDIRSERLGSKCYPILRSGDSEIDCMPWYLWTR